MLLSLNFELYFYVPRNPLDDSRFKIRPEQMNRRGIYKDIVGSVKGWTDYQLRPNFLIAMAVVCFSFFLIIFFFSSSFFFIFSKYITN